MGTLRLRLALWHALALSAILAVFAALIYGVVRDQLIRHHDTNPVSYTHLTLPTNREV